MGLLVEAAEERLVVEDVPEAVSDRFEPDVFVVERLAQEVLAGVEAPFGAYRMRCVAAETRRHQG